MKVIVRSYHPVSPKSYFCASCSWFICFIYAMIDHLMNTYLLMQLSHSPTKPPVRITSANLRASHRKGLAISRNSMRISSMVSSSYGSLFSIMDNLVVSINDSSSLSLNNSINASMNWVQNVTHKSNRVMLMSWASIWVNVNYLNFGISLRQKSHTINKNCPIISERAQKPQFFNSYNISTPIMTPVLYCLKGRFKPMSDKLKCLDCKLPLNSAL